MWDLIVSVPDHCLSFYFPHRGGILDLGSNKSIIGCLSYAFMFSAYVSTYEAQGPICVDGHVLDIVIPTQTTANL